MATTAIEIKPEPVAIEWHHGTIQELTDLIASHHLAFIGSCASFRNEANVREVGRQVQTDGVARTLRRTNGVGIF
jgi:hypothetical protein